MKGFVNGKDIKLILMHKSDTSTVGHPVGEVIIFISKLTLSPKCSSLPNPCRSQLLLHVEGNWAEDGSTSEAVQ